MTDKFGQIVNAVVTTAIVVVPPFDCYLTAIRPCYDCSTTYITNVWCYRNSIIMPLPYGWGIKR